MRTRKDTFADKKKLGKILIELSCVACTVCEKNVHWNEEASSVELSSNDNLIWLSKCSSVPLLSISFLLFIFLPINLQVCECGTLKRNSSLSFLQNSSQDFTVKMTWRCKLKCFALVLLLFSLSPAFSPSKLTLLFANTHTLKQALTNAFTHSLSITYTFSTAATAAADTFKHTFTPHLTPHCD